MKNPTMNYQKEVDRMRKEMDTLALTLETVKGKSDETVKQLFPQFVTNQLRSMLALAENIESKFYEDHINEAV